MRIEKKGRRKRQGH